MHVMTKTWISFGLVILALFEFWTAMRVFGTKKTTPWSKLSLKIHRFFGYVFLIYWIWICWVCIELLGRLTSAGGYELDARGISHAIISVIILIILLLKISIIRLYQKYRSYVPLLGMIIAGGAILVWIIAGALFLVTMGNVKPA